MTILEMSLRIKSYSKFIRWAIWTILAIMFFVFLIRVIVFEADYYKGKEGSERAVAAQTEQSTTEELDETKPSDDEVAEYTVAPDRPRYLSISKLGVVKSRILPMGVNASGELATPNNIFDVGWYEASGKPGQGGTMIIDGHNGGPHIHGVFKQLPELDRGDIIEVERGDGQKFQYVVAENKTVSLDESNKYMSVASRTPEPGKESLTLITCTGEWSQPQQTFLSRQFVRAVLATE